MNILPPADWSPATINLLILLPAAKSLKHQTKLRLSKFLKLGQTAQLRTARGVVVNSASLPSSETAREFLEKLRNSTHLHLLILDEFDWGASKGSNLNNYLQQVVAVRQEQARNKKDCWLLFLPISATPEMLLAPDDFYAQYSVSLSELAGSQTPESTYFATPTYQSIYGLNYERHEAKHEKLVEQSMAIKAEYEEAMKRFATGKDSLGTPADEVIRHLADNPTHTALVRFERASDVDDLKLLHSQLSIANFEFHNGEVKGEDSTFESLTGLLAVVQRCLRGDTISKHCRYYDVRSCYVREDILQLSTFKQDVGRCAGHGKDQAKVFNCLFSARGSGDRYEMSRLNLEKRCKRLHETLGTQKAKNKKLKSHPDREEIEECEKAYAPVFKTLRDSKSAVLLCAEPQIGKTGAFLSLLRLLHELYFTADATTTSSSTILEPTTEPFENETAESINNKTKQLYLLGREGFIGQMAQPEFFSDYHREMCRLNHSWAKKHVSPLFQVVSSIRNSVIDRLQNQETSFTVVDAGSGTCQLALELHAGTARFNDDDDDDDDDEENWTISVVALDVPTPSDWRNTLPESKKSEYDTLLTPTRQSGVKLSYFGGDYVESSAANVEQETVDFLLFSLSFSSGDDIGPEIRMARRLLKRRQNRQPAGTLYIADMAHRFKPEASFIGQMERFGFVLRTCTPLALHGPPVLLFEFRREGAGEDPACFQLEPKYQAQQTAVFTPPAVGPPAAVQNSRS